MSMEPEPERPRTIRSANVAQVAMPKSWMVRRTLCSRASIATSFFLRPPGSAAASCLLVLAAPDSASEGAVAAAAGGNSSMVGRTRRAAMSGMSAETRLVPLGTSCSDVISMSNTSSTSSSGHCIMSGSSRSSSSSGSASSKGTRCRTKEPWKRLAHAVDLDSRDSSSEALASKLLAHSLSQNASRFVQEVDCASEACQIGSPAAFA
mmetsp:Transcript_15496/g.48789  ORF Transcript_15496/g.48789 Transcript_15496/m.48789 type:complete len:207 (+) Transcript_15496:1130-1750(+)